MSKDNDLGEVPPPYDASDNSVKVNILPTNKFCVLCFTDIKSTELNNNCTKKTHTGKYIAEDCICNCSYKCDCGWFLYRYSRASRCKCVSYDEDTCPNEECITFTCCLIGLATGCLWWLPSCCCYNNNKDKQYWSCCKSTDYLNQGCAPQRHEFT
jgi:hypothetical protein